MTRNPLVRSLLAKLHKLERIIRDHRRKADAVREKLWREGWPG